MKLVFQHEAADPVDGIHIYVKTYISRKEDMWVAHFVIGTRDTERGHMFDFGHQYLGTVDENSRGSQLMAALVVDIMNMARTLHGLAIAIARSHTSDIVLLAKEAREYPNPLHFSKRHSLGDFTYSGST